MNVPELVCPACRRPPDGWSVSSASDRCTNPACGREHPRLDGTRIPVVLSGELDEVLHADHPIDFGDRGAIEAWLSASAIGGDAWEAGVRVGMYGRLHYDGGHVFEQLADRFLQQLRLPVTAALDLGCGPGRFARLLASRLGCNVTAIDSWPLALRLAAKATPSSELWVPTLDPDGIAVAAPLVCDEAPAGPEVRWICADVLDPPLPPASFDLVSAIALFDSVRDPALALGQAAALLRAGGHLLLAQPNAWNASVTPSSEWMSSDGHVWRDMLGHYGLEVSDEDDGFGWTMERGQRTSFGYRSHAMLVRKLH